MPLPNTRVVPAGWEAHHRPVSANAMPAHCVVTRPGSAGAVFDEATAQTTYLTAPTVYDGPCRVVAQNTTDPSTVADLKIVQGGYLIAVDTTADPIQADDVVTVTASDGDPTLVGAAFQVVGARRGTFTFERILVCRLRQPVSR